MGGNFSRLNLLQKFRIWLKVIKNTGEIQEETKSAQPNIESDLLHDYRQGPHSLIKQRL